MQYSQIDVVTRLNAVRSRIRDLEQQHLQVSLRVQAPDLNQPVNEQDRQNVQTLEESLSRLHTMEQQLSAPPQQASSSSPVPGPAAPAV